MNTIKNLEAEIKELKEELKDGEEYNNQKNYILRDEIKSKECLLIKFKEIRDRYKG